MIISKKLRTGFRTIVLKISPSIPILYHNLWMISIGKGRQCKTKLNLKNNPGLAGVIFV